MVKNLKLVNGHTGKPAKTKKSKGDIIEDNCALALMLRNSNQLLAQIHKQCNDQVAQNRLLIGLPTASDTILTEIILNTVGYKSWHDVGKEIPEAISEDEMDPEED